MKNRTDDRYLGMYVLLSSVAVSLFVAPVNSIDPVNLPKLCLLVTLSFVGVGFAFSRVDFIKAKKNRPALLVIGIFISLLFFALVADSRDFASKFYGTSGRNTGFVAYLGLSFLFFSSVVSATKILLKRYVVALVGSGAVLGLYGVAQFKGFDFYQFDLGIGTKVFGSFGNSNFQSAFMGITAATAITLVVFSRIQVYFKVGLLVLSLLAIYNISLSSQQGYLNFAAGITAAAVVYLFQSRKLILAWITVAGSSIFAVLVGAGIFNLGPLAETIYKSSLQARGYYWRAAIKMMIDYPLFGVGMDSYGEWYRRSRPANYSSTNFLTVSDTAHSIPLDIGSNGGVLLFIAYLAIIALVALSILRVIRRSSEFDVVFTTIVAAWVAYQAQSLISINQIGLGVWGWSLSGLIIGYELNTRKEDLSADKKSGRFAKLPAQKVSALAVVITFVTTGTGIAISLPPYLAADKFYKALQSGDANVIQPAAYLRPYDHFRFLYVAQILKQNQLEAQAIKVLSDASKIYPDSFEIWQLWSSIPLASPSDITQAKAEMKRLDPYNPNL